MDFLLDPMLLLPISFLAMMSCGLYVAIMGPSRFHRDGYVGRLHRWCSTDFPEVAGTTICCVLCCCRKENGKKSMKSCVERCGRRNWIFVALYGVFVWAAEISYLMMCLPTLRVPLQSKVVSWMLVFISEYLYAKAVLTDPGRVTPAVEVRQQLDKRWDSKSIVSNGGDVTRPGGKNRKRKSKAIPSRVRAETKENEALTLEGSTSTETPAGQSGTISLHPRRWFSRAPYSVEEEYILNRRYPVDGLLYSKIASPPSSPTQSSSATSDPSEYQFCNALGQKVGFGPACSTCMLPKPSRSKHCSVCGHCVRRFDHHCPWINNDVAENTQRYFVGFLFFHAISCVWAAMDLFALLKQFLMDHRLWGWQYYRHGTRQYYPLGLVEYLTILTSFQLLPMFLFFFAVCLAIVLFAFWGYVMSFVYRNLTMNDMNKIDDVLYFLDTLQTPRDLYREACRIRECMTQLSPTKKVPSGLAFLPPPSPAIADLGISSTKWTPTSEEIKVSKKYYKKTKREVSYALRKIFDRGILLNMSDVFFPTGCITPDLLEEVHRLVSREDPSRAFYGSILPSKVN